MRVSQCLNSGSWLEGWSMGMGCEAGEGGPFGDMHYELGMRVE